MWIGNLHKEKYRNTNWAGGTGKGASLTVSATPPAVGEREGKEKRDALDLNPLGDVQSSDGGREPWVPKGALSKAVSHQTLKSTSRASVTHHKLCSTFLEI